MSAQQLMERGRKEMKAQDESLIRAQRIVESTIEVGTKTAETLQAQGEQMDRVLDTLEDIRFDMKKAGEVIRDITRGLATDKCVCSAPHLWIQCSVSKLWQHLQGVCCFTTTKSAWPAIALGTSLLSIVQRGSGGARITVASANNNCLPTLVLLTNAQSVQQTLCTCDGR